MSEFTPVETTFHILDTTANVLQQELSYTYLEAVADTGENIFHGEVQQEVSETTKKRLVNEYEKIHVEQLKKEEIRKAFQLAILKGMKEAAQQNHQMTPDTVGMFIGYFVAKFMKSRESFSVLDPAIGAGNLLTSVLNQQPEDKQILSFGSEIDDLLIRLASINANLQQHAVELFNQDSLNPLFVDPVDIVVSDLPIGYYPNDSGAATYQLKADEGHSYAHHLFIEQSLKYTKEGGFLFFLIPNFLFTSDQAPKLHSYLKEVAYIQGLLQLPLSMFKDEKSAKSIFVLQKKGNGADLPKQALLADLPSFTNKEAVQKMMKNIDQWFKTEKGI